MSKKEFIIAIINSMPDWQMGWGIKAMVENNQLEDHTLDKIFVLFQRYLENLKDTAEKVKALNALLALRKMKEMQLAQTEQDDTDLQILETMIQKL